MIYSNIQVIDCIELCKSLPENHIDLTVTSPPYDQIRDYTSKGTLSLDSLGVELLRITKDGGICAMVIQDGTKEYGKSITTHRTICSWVDSGWKLFECCIYNRPGKPGAWWSRRFRVDHEYILLFLKGNRPNTFTKEHLKIPAKHAGVKWHGTQRMTDGTMTKIEEKVQADTKCPGTVWEYSGSSSESNKTKNLHPAPYPDKLCGDLIECFSKPDDIIFDPFLGSGTTAVMSKKLNRNFVGGDIAEQYIELAKQRINEECNSVINKIQE